MLLTSTAAHQPSHSSQTQGMNGCESDGIESLVTENATQQSTLEKNAIAFFQASVGNWQSRRRYYTLSSGETQEVVSDLTIHFLESDSSALAELGERHALTVPMVCGVKVTWESNYLSPARKPSTGSTIFGIRGDVMYRDRGFATPKPVTAQYRFIGDSPAERLRQRTMVLRTEYNGSAFEEELKLIGDSYRTRQTIISRAGAEIMIGQYLETRV
ncbi:MAG: phycobiliprotein lyase [Cyanobacteria bacterium P01_D01_bin.105]